MIKKKIKFFYEDNKFILNHSFSSILLSGLGMLLLLIQNIMVARFFGESTFGIFSFIINLFIILSIFSKFGLEDLLPREIPKLLESTSKLKGLYYFSISRTFIFTIITILLVYLCSIFYKSFNLEFKSIIFIIGFWFISRLLAELFSFFYQSINKTISSRLIVSIIPPFFSIIAILINSYFNFFVFSLQLIFEIITLSYLISFVLLVSLSNPFYIKDKLAPRFLIKKWMNSSVNFVILSSLFLFLSRINPLILAIYYPMEYVGYYSAVVNISFIISFGLNATNKILAPKLSEYYNNNNMDLFQKNLTLTARIGFFISIILFIPILMFPKYLLSIYGDNFSQFSNILIILSFGHLINSFCGPVGLSMTMTGNEKIVGFCVFFALLVNIILSFVLIPLFGPFGLAIANCIGIILWNVILVFYVKNRFNYKTTILA